MDGGLAFVLFLQSGRYWDGHSQGEAVPGAGLIYISFSHQVEATVRYSEAAASHRQDS